MELEKSGKFISRFKLDGEDPPHYYNIKKYYRYAKLSFLIIYVLIIPVSLIPEVIDVPYAAEFPLIIVIFIFVIGVIGILLLIADTLAYDITTNELVLHEFAVAVDAVEEGGDYKKCREHLKRARYLITKHDAKVFSDKRLSEVTEYISIISEADNYEPILEETFDEFYVRVLKPLYAEYDSEIDDIIDELNEEREESTGVTKTLAHTGTKLFEQKVGKKYSVIFLAFIIGGLVAYFVDERLGLTLVVVILTAISIISD